MTRRRVLDERLLELQGVVGFREACPKGGNVFNPRHPRANGSVGVDQL